MDMACASAQAKNGTKRVLVVSAIIDGIKGTAQLRDVVIEQRLERKRYVCTGLRYRSRSDIALKSLASRESR